MKLSKNERIEDLGINGYKLIQNKEYFCFGSDSVLLAKFSKSNKKNNIVLDLCSGSGVVPIVFSSKNEYDKIFAIEYQDEMYDLLKRNVSLNNLDITTFKEDIKNINNIKEMLKKHINKEVVDVITVNPPYKKINTGLKNQNKIKYNAKNETLCTLEDIFKISSILLENKGKLFIVHKPDRIVDLLTIARKYKLEAKNMLYVHPNVDSKPSIVLIEYSKNGGNECNINKPLIQYNKDLSYTKEFSKYIEMEKNE